MESIMEICLHALSWQGNGVGGGGGFSAMHDILPSMVCMIYAPLSEYWIFPRYSAQ